MRYESETKKKRRKIKGTGKSRKLIKNKLKKQWYDFKSEKKKMAREERGIVGK